MRDRRGAFVVFEGAEGVGKSTQVGRLAERLTRAGVAVTTVREPGGTQVGDDVRQIVLGPAHAYIEPRAEALLFMASRAQLIAQVIRPGVARGDIVLGDRHSLSTYAYQGGGRGISLDEVVRVNAFATAGLTPDLTILLDLPLDEALRRMLARSGPDRIERAGSDFHRQVATAFGLFGNTEWQAKHPEVGRIEVVDASGSVDQVAERVFDVVRLALAETIGNSLASNR